MKSSYSRKTYAQMVRKLGFGAGHRIFSYLDDVPTGFMDTSLPRVMMPQRRRGGDCVPVSRVKLLPRLDACGMQCHQLRIGRSLGKDCA